MQYLEKRTHRIFFVSLRCQVNHQQVSTFLTAGNIKLMLLHTGKNEESIRIFFQDVYELYVKVRADNKYIRSMAII
jgi:hypothetical protein